MEKNTIIALPLASVGASHFAGFDRRMETTWDE